MPVSTDSRILVLLIPALLGLAIKCAAVDVDIVILGDAKVAPGIAASINASRVHAARTTRLRFFIGFDGEPESLRSFLHCVGVDVVNLIIRRPPMILDDDELAGWRQVDMGEGDIKIGVRSNFARFSVSRTFPEVGTAWFLDADTLPIADLAPPLLAFIASGKMVAVADHPDGRTLAMPPRPEFPWFSSGAGAFYAARYHAAFPWESQAWNNGVFIADFSRWGRRRIEGEAVALFRANVKADLDGQRLWRLNTQPIMQILFAANGTHALGPGWNCYPPAVPVPPHCRILHWAASLTKPWERNVSAPGPRKFWRRYLAKYRDVNSCRSMLR